MTGPTLVPASALSPTQRADLLNAAYVDYLEPIRLSTDQFSAIEDFYSVDPGQSVVALQDGAPAGLALLARRGDRGWISGVGVTPEYRRRGIARAMMTTLFENARGLHLNSLTLEVIDRNAAARGLYRELGFREVRELLVWRHPADADPLPVPDERLFEATPGALLRHYRDWHPVSPCWQREVETIRHMAAGLRGFALKSTRKPAGYCLVAGRGDSISIVDVAVDPAAGMRHAGRAMLQALCGLYPGKTLTINNVPADDLLCEVLAALRFLVTVRQIEMIWP